MSSPRPHRAEATGALARSARWSRRLLALLIGLALVPVATEIALRTASLFPEASRAVGGGAAFVVCQGDSNTYGFNLPEELAYPAQLEALLAESGVRERVVNRGVPGKPTWVVRDELAEDLERYRPRAIAFLVGINDRSMLRPETRTERVVSRFRSIALARRLIDGLALRLEEERAADAMVLTRDELDEREDGTVRIRMHDRSDERRPFLIRYASTEPEVYVEWIAADLAEAAAEARAAGVVPLLIAYPLDRRAFELTNDGIEEAARRSGARLVDTRAHFAEAIERLGEPALVFRDGHPTAIGYGIVARAVLGALVAEGLLETEAPHPLSAIDGWEPPTLELEPWAEDGRTVGVRLRYAPGYQVQVLFARSTGSTRIRWRGAVVPLSREATRRPHSLPLAADDVFESSWRQPAAYLVRFDANGAACVPMPPAPRTDAAGALFAAAVVIAPPGIVVETSAALELR